MLISTTKIKHTVGNVIDVRDQFKVMGVDLDVLSTSEQIEQSVDSEYTRKAYLK